jgi:hypothetical protein
MAMHRRARTAVTGGLRPRQQKRRSNSTLIALLVFVLLALLFLSRTRQVAIPRLQPTLVHH